MQKIKTYIKKIFKKMALFEPNSPTVIRVFYAFFLFFSLSLCLVFSSMGSNLLREMAIREFQDPATTLEKSIRTISRGYPLERMSSHISKRDKKVALFLVAIAKKESNWGKYSPRKNGKECFNYWGYRGWENRTASGYSCFDTPGQAIEVVGDRIEELVVKEKANTPKKIVIAWKCGYDCSWDNPVAVQKWVDDVSFYYKKLN